MSAQPSQQPLYLEGAADASFAVLHLPARGTFRETGVIICPPFGWDETCSYRSRREWARSLAQAGHPTIRLSYPATGDSGGFPRDVGRVMAWRDSVCAAAQFLRSTAGVRRVAAIGLGLGGLIAYCAASSGGPIDDLVLWATPARGRALVRELRAFSRLEIAQFFEGLAPPPPLPSGELEAAGFLMSAQTVRDLEQLDLRELTLPVAQSRRALLLERDGIAVDDQLRGALERQGAAVTVAPGEGYGTMTAHPQQARVPLKVIERVNAWLDHSPDVHGGAVEIDPARVGASESVLMRSGDGALVRETPFAVPQPFGVLAGVLVQPEGSCQPGPCCLLLNAGAVRRIGPSRMWVEVARRWAARGLTMVRLDVEGIGDADGEASPYAQDASLYVPTLIPQVLATLDFLEEQGIGQRFLLAGLCAGAYWSFHAALRDARVTGAVMMNPRQLMFDPSLGAARDFRALMSERRSWAKIRKQASIRRVSALARWMVGAPLRRISGRANGTLVRGGDLDVAFEQLEQNRKRITFVFSSDEPLHYELVHSGRLAQIEQRANTTVDHVPVKDHTMRPNWSQQRAHEALDRALERELSIDETLQRAAGSSLA